MVIATGFFDGVHVGHRQVLGQLVKEARARGEESMVITFWPHPRTVLQKDARTLRLLTSLEEKKEIIQSLGVDRVEVLDFSREFSSLSCEQYLRDVVKGRFGGSAVLLGYDNRIGSDCCSPDQAAQTASRLGLDVIRCDAVTDSAASAVSSTRIRAALEQGRVDAAGEMLGSLYRLRGVVVAGNQLGRTIGFPTANIHLYDPLKMVPGNGVYLVEVRVLGHNYYGMCNIGVRPTVGGSSRTIETNIFDFDEDIYGLDIRLSFVRKIRDERKYTGLDALKDQLTIDKRDCLSMI